MSPDLAANRDDLVPGKIIETVKLARVLPEVYVYRDLLDALRRYAGYRQGDWENPGAGDYQDTVYVFPYDWRQDNVRNARELVRRIERGNIFQVGMASGKLKGVMSPHTPIGRR